MIAELLAVATALQAAIATPAPRARPFLVGERATYEVDYFFADGAASMEVVSIDTVRNRSAFHFRFVVSGKASFIYSIVDTLNSWTDTTTFASLRFHQDQLEKKTKRVRRFEIFPETKTYVDGQGRAPKPSVESPLDDVAMLYFIRQQPLVVGQTYRFHNYFRPASNPITVRVVKRDTLKLSAGRRAAIVVQPIIKSSDDKGPKLFSEDAGALVWFSDDSARVILQIKVKGPLGGTMTMKLKSYSTPNLPAVQNQHR